MYCVFESLINDVNLPQIAYECSGVYGVHSALCEMSFIRANVSFIECRGN